MRPQFTEVVCFVFGCGITTIFVVKQKIGCDLLCVHITPKSSGFFELQGLIVSQDPLCVVSAAQ